MKRRLTATPLILVLSFAALPARALDTLVPDSGVSGPGGAKFNVAVRNDTGQSVRFELRPKSAEWTTYTLSPNEKAIYSCLGCEGAFEISVNTAGTVVTYGITTGNLYAIRENDSRHIYDVYQVQ